MIFGYARRYDDQLHMLFQIERQIFRQRDIQTADRQTTNRQTGRDRDRQLDNIQRQLDDRQTFR